MSHQETLTRYVANFIDELALSGVENVVISPGSRSTPLAMLVSAHDDLKKWVLVDERSAAFFALGMARKTNRPTVLICTSGTAAANYYPAVIEAYHARIPLIVLTADRPHELRGVGAPQAMNQLRLYGEFVKDFQEMAAPSMSEGMLAYVRQRAARAVRISMADHMGPVQYNFPFQEPLLPDLDLEDLWGNREAAYNPLVTGSKQLSESQLQALKKEIKAAKRPLFVCGPQTDQRLAQALIKLAEKLAIPVLMDPVSQGRSKVGKANTVIASYDAILRESDMRKALQPDLIIRFGAMPISKMYRFFVEAHQAAKQYVVEVSDEILEPTNHHSSYLMTDPLVLCQTLNDQVEKQAESPWLAQWLKMEHVVQKMISDLDNDQLTEGHVASIVRAEIPDKSNLFVSNSMPVRDMDTFFLPTEKDIFLYANRGVSGIDGIHSTALGMAAVTDAPTTLVLGDLSFYHDMNGLLAAKKYDIPMTVVLVNNDGGGIFSFLPQSQEATHFESLFGTALDMDFSHVASLYNGRYQVATTVADFKTALQASYENKGLQIIEVKTNRQDNLSWHRSLWQKISKEVGQCK